MEIEIDRSALLRSFREESEELLSELERLALDLAENPKKRSIALEMFRCAHTLKGSASCVGYDRVTALSHELEDLFEAITSNRRECDQLLWELVLEAVDLLRRGCRAPEEQREAPLEGAVDLVERMLGWLAIEVDAEQKRPSWVDEQSPRRGEASRTLRVDVAKLDQLLNLAGEVAVAQGRLGASIGSDSPAHGALQAFQGLFQSLQESVMRLRVVRLGPSFERFRRAVHELSQRVEKHVELVVEGGDVEVDVTLAEAVRDPLLHMIRNAIDHGIESTETRFAAGKHWPGRITLSARYDGNYAVLRVADDGAGLDRERLLEKAKQLGVTVSEDDDTALHELLFRPGVSTAREVTDISGRGIGMDVVRRSVEALRGTIAIESEPGLGMTVSMRIPLSLALIQGFGVQVGGETYIVPVDSIRECVDLDHEHALGSTVGGVVELRGKPLPFVDLAERLGAERTDAARRSIVVLEHGGKRAGLDVDGLLGEVQTVIKPLGPLFAGCKNVAGSAVLHDGRVALVLDVGSLFRELAA
jgi:two-component system, chemotaxis family, sensor kinase CheA